MGAILAVLGGAGDQALPRLLQRMTDRSPYCGAVERHLADGLAVAVQSLGWDASLAVAADRLVAVHGYLGSWERQPHVRALGLDPNWSAARKLAVAHRELGRGLFPLLRGEFAILIHQPGKRRLIIARDLVGCRPLFLEQREGRAFLATEIRQVLAGSGSSPSVNREPLLDYLLNRPRAREETLLRPVRRVLPGRTCSFETDRPDARPGQAEYWQPPWPPGTSDHTGEAVEALRSLIEPALEAALPDRPSALGLSGGVDSTTLWALTVRRAEAGDQRAGQCAPYSLVYPGLACDERPLIEKVIRHTHRGAAGGGRAIHRSRRRAPPGCVPGPGGQNRIGLSPDPVSVRPAARCGGGGR